ncbi:hypothetical protein M431DRAFT_485749 [Trichoderma harzianum CBS 226.95]|jgi:hypothetical protein|uniref:Uncharacterized protein n=1 Tax=Trichoderma harzianum CBS 226.95 TaxID=983964 RepID=A0A2T4A029_TRIHA|nr:hypothetical protein M431DRAFT_485749 [Trichoderma harzianum CBS 226.95]PTB50353.1 hypothetical protein M431DRAFT_485749 [Trichoderma harzianum CBS 226.95]
MGGHGLTDTAILFSDEDALGSVQWFHSYRAFHDGKADSLTLSVKRCHQTRKLKISVGYPQEAYVIIGKGVGFVMRVVVVMQAGLGITCFSLGQSPAHHPSWFSVFRLVLRLWYVLFSYTRMKQNIWWNNATRYSTAPRTIIDQNLPQHNIANMRSATLWL